MTLDLDSEEKARLLAPETNVFDLNSLDDPSNALELPKPVAGTAANWLTKTDYDSPDPSVIERMRTLQV